MSVCLAWSARGKCGHVQLLIRLSLPLQVLYTLHVFQCLRVLLYVIGAGPFLFALQSSLPFITHKSGLSLLRLTFCVL